MLRVVVFTLLLFQSFAAFAQPSAPKSTLVDVLPSGYLERLIATVRDRIHELVLTDGSKVPREAPAERAQPLLPHAVERRIVDAGMRSGMGYYCKLDWQAHFRAMMAFERRTGTWSDKQTSYMGALHGAGQGITMENAKPCDAALREKVLVVQNQWIERYRTAPGAAPSAAVSPAPAPAPQSGPPISSMIGLFTAEQIDRLIVTVRDNVHRLVLSDGSSVPRENATERAQPLLPPDVERRAVDAGMVSGVSEWCGIDPHLHYTAMMD